MKNYQHYRPQLFTYNNSDSASSEYKEKEKLENVKKFDKITRKPE